MITIQINDSNKAALALLEYLKTLDFVSFPTTSTKEKEENKITWLVDDISEQEKKEIEQDLTDIKNGKMKSIPVKQAFREIREELKEHRNDKI